MKTRAWPSLELRARIARRRKTRAAFDGITKHIIAAILPGPPLPSTGPESAQPQERRNFIEELEEADEAELEDVAAHVKDCPNCKAELARAARAGAYVPEKLLVAAGIEILRN